VKSLLKTLRFYKAIGYKFVDPNFLKIADLGEFKDLNSLHKTIKSCQLCELSKVRKNAVFDKKTAARIMVILKNPTIADDEKGEPMSGNLGLELKHLLHETIGVISDEIYVSYLLKCKTGANSAIKSDNLLKCTPFLFEEISKISPKLILTFGEIASRALIPNLPPLEISHGSIFRSNRSLIIPLFSMNFVSKNPSKREILLDDLKKIKNLRLLND